MVGGVEAVIQTHAELLLKAGYSVRLIAGAGNQAALPAGAEFKLIPEMNSLHPEIVKMSQRLDAGRIPDDFEPRIVSLEQSLIPALKSVDNVIIHNIFTKHFNLALTAALVRILDQNKISNCIAWCHDFTWTSQHSRSRVHSGYPWDLLRIYREDVTYVTVSQHRREELAGLFHCPIKRIKVVYNGVDPGDIYSLSQEGKTLIELLDLDKADLIILMPVRITQAKNIEFAMQVVSSLKNAGIQPKLVVTGPPDPHEATDMQYYQSLLDLRYQLQVEDEVRFVYESGPQSDEGYTISLSIVRELYRLCDLLLMPSHREGFGMPIVEAGFVGMPVYTTPIPAALEIGGADVVQFSFEDRPETVSEMMLHWLKTNSRQTLRRRVRQNYTWQAIFHRDILPLLKGKEAE